MTSATTSFLLASLAALASCATTEPSSPKLSYSNTDTPLPSAEIPAPVEKAYSAPAPPMRAGRKPLFRLEVFAEDIELDKLEYEPDIGLDFDILGVDRKRSGMRAAFGKSSVRGYVQLFGEG